MQRVTGIGGIFIKARGDAAALREWYRRNLGIEVADWGGAAFPWQREGRVEPDGVGTTIWTVFDADTTYLAPSPSPFMVNYRVDDLDAMRAQLLANGCEVDDKVERSEYGAFGWVMDLEGNRIELWQPPPAGAAP